MVCCCNGVPIQATFSTCGGLPPCPRPLGMLLPTRSRRLMACSFSLMTAHKPTGLAAAVFIALSGCPEIGSSCALRTDGAVQVHLCACNRMPTCYELVS